MTGAFYYGSVPVTVTRQKIAIPEAVWKERTAELGKSLVKEILGLYSSHNAAVLAENVLIRKIRHLRLCTNIMFGFVFLQLLEKVLLHQNLARCSQCNKVKCRLAQVDAYRTNLHVDDPP